MDVAEATRESTNWMAARHKRLLELAVVPVERASVAPLAIERALSVVTEDFEARQYYVTGKLTKSIYAPRCVFDSPDPDTPVRSPQVFASALKGLFDARTSQVELLDAVWISQDNALVADWRLEGRLKLPWRPPIKPFVGRTTFTLNAASGLVERHDEEWSCSAFDAFVSVLFPGLGARLSSPAPPAAQLRARMGARHLSLADRWPGAHCKPNAAAGSAGARAATEG